MKVTLGAATIALALFLCTSRSFGQSAVIGPDTLLRQECDFSQLPVLSNNVASLQSSYDRSGGNSDSGNYLSTNNNVAVLADLKGPGAVIRIWSANPQGTLKIYIDDNPVPVVSMPFTQLFDNSTAPFLNPVAGQSSGGFYCYLPITYSAHCVITTEPLGYYYQITSVSFPVGTAVRPFSLPITASDQEALDTVKAGWSSLAVPVTLPDLTRTKQLRPMSTMVLAKYRGPGEITQIRMTVVDPSDADLRKIVIRGYFDGHKNPDFEAPLSDFFGNAYGRKPFSTLLLAQSADGKFQANFPMPFGSSALFTVESGLSLPVPIGISADVIKRPFNSSVDGYFHATWSNEITTPGKPHTWLKIAGQRGKFIGIVQTMNGLGLGFLEGDDQIRVDSQMWTPTPSNPTTLIGPWNGTGTEDCFNSGWYFSGGPNCLPMNGALVRQDAGQIDCFRWFIDDAPTFQSSIDAQIEQGGVNDTPGTYYSSVAYWYSNGPMVEVAPFPRAQDIMLPVPPKPLVMLPNAIEGESLSAQASGGSVTVQGMIAFGRLWSNNEQLFWHGAQINDTLTLPITPAAAGTYDLVGYFTKAVDYGQTSFQLNGAPIGLLFDGYNNGVIASGPVDLGTVTLPAGPSQLKVTIVGKNAAATNTFFGLDALCLNAIGTPPVALPAN